MGHLTRVVRVVKSLADTLPVDRPRCGNCHKPLPPWVREVEVGSADEVPPSPGTGKPRFGPAFSYVQVIRICAHAYPQGSHVAEVWDGYYKGYENRGDGHPLFCTLRCAATFAGAAYRAGYRIKGDK